jgi:hypothetical protein
MKKLVAGMFVLSACSGSPDFSLRQKRADHSAEVASAREDFSRLGRSLVEGIRIACVPSYNSIPLGTPISAKTLQNKNRN